jgi:hypothetical protein
MSSTQTDGFLRPIVNEGVDSKEVVRKEYEDGGEGSN